jgi:hypothetical protein
MSSLTKHELVDVSILHLRDGNDDFLYAETDGEPDHSKPMRIHLYGPGTKQFAKAQAERQNKAIARIQRKGQMKMTAKEMIEERAEFLVNVTKEFENIESDTGAVAEDLMHEVYGNPKLSHWAEQAETHSRNTANFTQGSTKP